MPNDTASGGRHAAPAEQRGDGDRLQNVLSQAGIASRRHAADMIRAGHVCVNGKVVREPGYRVTPGAARITVNGADLPVAAAPRRTIMMNKPAGLLCSADAAQGRTVCELVAHLPERLVPVGRLDKHSSGLLLLSNDGDLIARVTHPRHGHRKFYDVEVAGRCDEAALAKLRAPMTIDGYALRPVEVRVLRHRGGRAWIRFVLREGRNRQIRQMCGQAGLNVLALNRIGIDNLRLGKLPPGAWRDLRADEVAALMCKREV
ncbi:MAG: pseudouridine synthase [Kiritimatiellae bacterium]|nr:pseudouridine synthase [Kiritimatiellia bacterium]